MALHMFVGSCNVPTPYFGSANGNGVSVCLFDAESGLATPVTRYEGIDNPTFLSKTPDGRRIFANSELFGRAQGHMTALEFDPLSGEIAHMDVVASRGQHHVSQFSQPLTSASSTWRLSLWLIPYHLESVLRLS